MSCVPAQADGGGAGRLGSQLYTGAGRGAGPPGPPARLAYRRDHSLTGSVPSSDSPVRGRAEQDVAHEHAEHEHELGHVGELLLTAHQAPLWARERGHSSRHVVVHLRSR